MFIDLKVGDGHTPEPLSLVNGLTALGEHRGVEFDYGLVHIDWYRGVAILTGEDKVYLAFSHSDCTSREEIRPATGMTPEADLIRNPCVHTVSFWPCGHAVKEL